MLLASILWALLLRLACYGTLRHLTELKLRYEGVFALLLVIQLILPGLRAALPAPTILAAWILLLLALLVLALLNLSSKGMATAAAGIACNCVVIVLNRGMPVVLPASVHFQSALGSAGLHHRAGAQTLLLTLADVAYVPALKAVVSVGDVLLVVGVMAFLLTTPKLSTRAGDRDSLSK